MSFLTNMEMKCLLPMLFAFLEIFGFASSLRTPPFLPLEPPRFLEHIRQDILFPSVSSRPFTFGQIQGNMKYRDRPLEIDAGFHFKPLLQKAPGLVLPPLFPPSFIPDMFHNFRRFEHNLFTPSRGGERAETPGQIKNFETDLEEIEKENEVTSNESTTDNFGVDETTATASSYVRVGVTGADNKEYKYNYSV